MVLKKMVFGFVSVGVGLLDDCCLLAPPRPSSGAWWMCRSFCSDALVTGGCWLVVTTRRRISEVGGWCGSVLLILIVVWRHPMEV